MRRGRPQGHGAEVRRLGVDVLVADPAAGGDLPAALVHHDVDRPVVELQQRRGLGEGAGAEGAQPALGEQEQRGGQQQARGGAQARSAGQDHRGGQEQQQAQAEEGGRGEQRGPRRGEGPGGGGRLGRPVEEDVAGRAARRREGGGQRGVGRRRTQGEDLGEARVAGSARAEEGALAEVEGVDEQAPPLGLHPLQQRDAVGLPGGQQRGGEGAGQRRVVRGEGGQVGLAVEGEEPLLGEAGAGEVQQRRGEVLAQGGLGGLGVRRRHGEGAAEGTLEDVGVLAQVVDPGAGEGDKEGAGGLGRGLGGEDRRRVDALPQHGGALARGEEQVGEGRGGGGGGRGGGQGADDLGAASGGEVRLSEVGEGRGLPMLRGLGGEGQCRGAQGPIFGQPPEIGLWRGGARCGQQQDQPRHRLRL